MAEEKVDEMPDIYCNGVQMGISAYDLMIDLQRSAPVIGAEAKPVSVGRIRMSLEHAKVLAVLLRKNLKAYEDQTGSEIAIHPDVLNKLGISKQEDW